MLSPTKQEALKQDSKEKTKLFPTHAVFHFYNGMK